MENLLRFGRLLIMVFSFIVVTACEDDEVIGSVNLSMRNWGNGGTELYMSGSDYLYVDNANNFTFSGQGEIYSLGQVSGLHEVDYIPENKGGWVKRVAAYPGGGYVVRNKVWDGDYENYHYVYMRVYVYDYIESVEGGILGVRITYQMPFVS